MARTVRSHTNRPHTQDIQCVEHAAGTLNAFTPYNMYRSYYILYYHLLYSVGVFRGISKEVASKKSTGAFVCPSTVRVQEFMTRGLKGCVAVKKPLLRKRNRQTGSKFTHQTEKVLLFSELRTDHA